MTTAPLDQPRDNGGRYGPKHRAEVPQLDLSGDPSAARQAWKYVQSVRGRHAGDLGAVSANRVEAELKAELRTRFPAITEDDFRSYASSVALDFSTLTSVEDADPWDTDAYGGDAAAAGIVESDYPVDDPDWVSGDGVVDYEAYHEAVVEHYEYRVYEGLEEMQRADEEWALGRA